MGLFSFIKEAGEKLFGRGEVEAAELSAEEKTRRNQAAAQAIFDYINSLGLKWANLQVSYTSGQVVITGTTPDQENREKIILAAGNVQGVDNVDDQLVVEAPAAEPKFYTVVKGDTLWKIAASQYGNGAKYPLIFEANKPMLKDPDKIYPGQNLRIPPL
jgi:nucleoid-associated protein YgaU